MSCRSAAQSLLRLLSLSPFLSFECFPSSASVCACLDFLKPSNATRPAQSQGSKDARAGLGWAELACSKTRLQLQSIGTGGEGREGGREESRRGERGREREKVESRSRGRKAGKHKKGQSRGGHYSGPILTAGSAGPASGPVGRVQVALQGHPQGPITGC